METWEVIGSNTEHRVQLMLVIDQRYREIKRVDMATYRVTVPNEFSYYIKTWAKMFGLEVVKVGGE